MHLHYALLRPLSLPSTSLLNIMSFQNLIGKTAPSITLQNYDGESYTFTPGAKGLPSVIFFYPESGMLFHSSSD